MAEDNNWFDKAKEEAKKLAEAAKNANYGEMFDKTKAAAMQAAEEAKKAASSVMSKGKGDEKSEVVVEEAGLSSEDTLKLCNARLEKIETLLSEVKSLLGTRGLDDPM